MIVNQALIELTKQVAVAVEEIKFSPAAAAAAAISNSNSNSSGKLKSSCDSPSSKSSKSSSSSVQQTPSTPSQQPQQQPQHYSSNSTNPYYAQQVLLQLQKPSTFVKHVHVVVKNTPFGITLRSKEPSQFNFQNYVIKATLVYDSDPPKMVDFIHNEPLQYVATVSEDGSEVTVDVKVGILSSQHQGSMFLVVLHISHYSAPTPSSSEPISTILTNISNNSIHSLNVTNICVVSHPIRIVSKLDHVKKEGIPILKKRTFHEILTDKLKKLQKSQDSQTKWIKNLYQQHGAEYDFEPFNSALTTTATSSNTIATISSNSSSKNDSQCSSSSSTPSFNSSKPLLITCLNNNTIKNELEMMNSVLVGTVGGDDDDDENDEDDDENDNESESSGIGSTQLIGRKLIQNQTTTLSNVVGNLNSNLLNNPCINSNNSNCGNNIININSNSNNVSNNFQNSFNRVVEVFNQIPDYEKIDVVRSMVEQLKSFDLDQLVTTFIDELKGGYDSTLLA